ncbi:MAG: membrane protein insertase YidC, partial [Gemmatimonadota bacterium]|nr:membrane protein insertase YidC [Gemmatimonadota bacterium]
PRIVTAPPSALPVGVPPRAAADGPAQRVTVESPLYRYTFSTGGAAMVGAELLRYPSLLEEDAPVQLVPSGTLDFLAYRLAVGDDTLDLRSLPFRVSAPALRLGEDAPPSPLRFVYSGVAGLEVEIVYTFRPDQYLIQLRGTISGAPPGAVLLTELGPGLASRDDEREIALVALQEGDAEQISFPEQGEAVVIEGPLPWAGVKDKYFLAALVTGGNPPFSRVVARRLPTPRAGREESSSEPRPRITALAALPLDASGSFAYDVFVGPQENDVLLEVGYGLEEVTPYGYRWLRPVVRPIAAATLWVLSYLHNILGVSYGWALILFGIMVKLVLWPLNAKAMRAQMRNMAVQPLLQELQAKHKDDPQRQQQEMVRLYKEHGFNPLAGCLPLLIPMPVFITLFFVFQNAIAFRGTEFWWMPDLSQKDPYYIIPILFVISTFLAQWVSTKLSGMETNPQMKMMMYVLPVVMGVFFFNFASGLNLYYTASNVAGLPQQVLIARERRRATEAAKVKQVTQPTLSTAAGPAKKARPAKKRKK